MRAPRNRTGDEGLTLVEIMVTMAVMSVLMMVFTASMIQVYRTLNATELLSVAQAQLQTSFKRLDKEIRYASWVAAPSTTSPYYVEFALPPDANGDVQCRQLRLDGAVLQLLQWEAGSPPAAGQRGQTLASSLVANDLDPDVKVARYPFILQLPGDYPYAADAAGIGTKFSTEYYRLRVRLTTKVYGRYIRSDITFTALNTSRATKTGTPSPCAEGRP